MPQYPTIPTDTPPIPEGFDGNLWLGPSLDRPYHLNYAHCVFRGGYEFGGGALADMGHYSLWPVFPEFNLNAPIAVESRPAYACTLNMASPRMGISRWLDPFPTRSTLAQSLCVSAGADCSLIRRT